MSKRIYHQKYKRLFQHRPGGSYYVFMGSQEVCLETNDDEVAVANLKYLDDTSSFFGPAAFKYRVKDLFPRFLKDKERDVRATTFKGYQALWGIFERPFGKLKVAEINQRRWEEFCKERPGVRDFQCHKNLMHQFLVWCEMKEFTRAVPTLKNPKHKRRKRKVIPPEHIILIFQEAKQSRGGILVFLTFLALQGPRQGEIRKLAWIYIDFERRSARFIEDDVKTGEGREIPLNALVIAILKQHLLRQQESKIKSRWVFPNARDPKRYMSQTGFKTAWYTCLRNAGLQEFGYTLHDWRATYETYLQKNNALSSAQKRKVVGADEDLQLRTYVTMGADDLRGAENVVDVPELIRLLSKPTVSLSESTGPTLEGESIENLNKGDNV